ncbi:MAG: hypothetical protein WA484_05090 [Solirubrobacteraceae bacterium]
MERKIQAVERGWPWALAALMLLDAVLLLYMGRGLSFYFDDWDFVTHDFGGGIHSLLAAHVGNVSVFPVAIYKILFHLVGLNHYAIYRLVVIGLHLFSAGLIFVLAARRIPRVPALLATALILFLGAAWEDLLWAFQIGYMLSIAGGLAAWVLLEREDRRSDIVATVCVIVAAGSSSLGIPIMIGIAVELAWQGHWRRVWVGVVPAVLYLMWYAGYGESQITKNGLINAPGFVEDLAATAFGGLVGRALEWGRPLALLGVVVLLRRLVRPPPVTPRLAGLLATGLSLWFVTAATRSTISVPETSRYIYFGAVVIVLVGVELLREITITPVATALATPLVAFFVVTGLTVMHAGATGLRETSKTVTAELGSLELAAAHAPPSYQPDTQRAPQIKAGPYLHTVHAIGSSPADAPNEIVRSDPAPRAAADNVLLALEPPKLMPVTDRKALQLSPAPSIASAGAGVQVHRGGCVALTALSGETVTGMFTLPSSGAIISDEGNAAATVAIKRFGDSFDLISPTVAPRGTVALSVATDAGHIPWVVQVSSLSSLSICGLRG